MIEKLRKVNKVDKTEEDSSPGAEARSESEAESRSELHEEAEAIRAALGIVDGAAILTLVDGDET